MARKEYKADVVLGHADEADGIEEYDNKLPNWWLGLFFITIIVGIWMMLDWHVIGHKSLAEQYDDQMAAADERYAGMAVEAPTEIALDEATIAAGAEIFATNCVACHAADGTGGVGPNLTDNVWIHGGTPVEIAATIFNGVPEQGMVTWGPLIGADGVAKVAAYVVSFGGATGVDDLSAVDDTQVQVPDEATEPEVIEEAGEAAEPAAPPTPSGVGP